MRTLTKLGGSLLLALLLALPAAAQNDELLIRATEDDIEEIADRHGLEIVDELRYIADNDENQSVYRLRAPHGYDRQLVLDTLRDHESDAVSFEPVTLASLPEVAGAAAADPATLEIGDGFDQIRRLSPPLATVDDLPTGDSGLRLREMDLEKNRPRVEELRFALQYSERGNLNHYAMFLEFAEGCSVALVDGENLLRPDAGEGRLIADKERASWLVPNDGEEKVWLERLEVDWPVENGALVAVELGGKTVFEGTAESGPLTLDEFRGDEKDREAKPGLTELTLYFHRDFGPDEGSKAKEWGASPRQSLYTIAADFSDGSRQELPPCVVAAGRKARAKAELIEWEVYNYTDIPLHLTSVRLGLPGEAGYLEAIKGFNGRTIFKLEHDLEIPFGLDSRGEERLVWREYVLQEAAMLLRVPEAQAKHTGAGVIVAVIDSGIDPEHELLAHRVIKGYDFVRDQSGFASEWEDLLDQSTVSILSQSTVAILSNDGLYPLDQSTVAILSNDERAALADRPAAFGHGTMVAGIIHRVAPDAMIMPLKAFDADGRGNLVDIVEAIYYAVDNGAHVINMSFSLPSFSPELMRAINYANRSGVTCIAAAGNDGDELVVFPAAFANVLGVAASTPTDELSGFSNRGWDMVSVAAPGEWVLTTYPGGWAFASGSSFAAPWISGVAALFAEKSEGQVGFHAASRAIAHAVPLQGESRHLTAYGRADLKEAIYRLPSALEFGKVAANSYSLRLEFEEGCWIEYPPRSGGTDCSVAADSQLVVDGKKLRLVLTNLSTVPVTLAAIEFSWPDEHGSLKKIELSDETLYDEELPAGFARVDSGWKDELKPESVELRQLPEGSSGVLEIEFDEAATSGE